jgi:hypothetical protein
VGKEEINGLLPNSVALKEVVFPETRKLHVRIQSVVFSHGLDAKPTYYFILVVAVERSSLLLTCFLFLGIRVASL